MRNLTIIIIDFSSFSSEMSKSEINRAKGDREMASNEIVHEFQGVWDIWREFMGSEIRGINWKFGHKNLRSFFFVFRFD